MLFGLYLTKYLSRYIYRLNIIETLFMRRTTLKEITHNSSYERNYGDLKGGYARIEPRLEKKEALSKTNIINLVDVMCQSRRFKVSWQFCRRSRDERIYKKAH